MLTEGKICYLQLPALDVEQSATFYATVFGWRIRRRGDGSTAFDDSRSGVSGSWVVGAPPHDRPGLLLHVRVRDVAATLAAIAAAGGAVVEAAHGEPPEIHARFADPAGNVLGIFAEGGW